MVSSGFRVGLQETEINPPLGLMSGDGAPRITGIRTPLYIKAAVLDNGHKTLAIVTLDVMGMELQDSDAIRAMITAECGIPPEGVMLCCSHTHVGPSTLPSCAGYKKSVDPSCDDEALAREKDFITVFNRQIADTVKMAFDKREEGSVGYQKLTLPWLTFNRRRLTKDSGAWTYWMRIPKSIAYGVEGPTDPDLHYYVLRDRNFAVSSIIWVYAGHNSFFFDDKYSADISYAVQEAFDKKVGRHIPTLYIAGCGGNLNYYDYEKTVDDKNIGLEKASEAVASAIYATYQEVCTLTAPTLDAVSSRVMFAQHDITDNWWKDDIQLKLSDFGICIENEIESRKREPNETYTSEIMAFRIGNSMLVSLPGEVFVEIGLAVKDSSPFDHTIVAAYANDYAGYVAAEPAFLNGSYEVWPALNSRICKEGGRFMVEKAIEMTRTLDKGGSQP